MAIKGNHMYREHNNSSKLERGPLAAKMNYLTKEFSPFSAQPQTHPQSQTNLSMKLEAKNIYGASYN